MRNKTMSVAAAVVPAATISAFASAPAGATTMTAPHPEPVAA